MIFVMLAVASLDFMSAVVKLDRSCRGLENELAKLIQDNQIQARIDSNAKILHARHTNVRSQTFQAALQAGLAMHALVEGVYADC